MGSARIFLTRSPAFSDEGVWISFPSDRAGGRAAVQVKLALSDRYGSSRNMSTGIQHFRPFVRLRHLFPDDDPIFSPLYDAFSTSATRLTALRNSVLETNWVSCSDGDDDQSNPRKDGKGEENRAVIGLPPSCEPVFEIIAAVWVEEHLGILLLTR